MPALSKVARDAIEDPDNELLVSAASAMEVVTKHRLGKLPGAALLAQNFEAIVRAEGFVALPSRLDMPRSPVGFRSRTRTLSIAS